MSRLCICAMETAETNWVSSFQWLRGLNGVKLMVCDRYLGMLGAVGEVSRSQVPALYRTLLPQCTLRNASLQGKAGSIDAQGDPRLGRQENRLGESQN